MVNVARHSVDSALPTKKQRSILEDLKVRRDCQMAPSLCGAIGMTRFGREKKIRGEKVLAGAPSPPSDPY